MTKTTQQPQSGPGKHYRKGITLLELADMFPDETAARSWFEGELWADGRICGHCGSDRTIEAKHKTMPYRCRDCSQYFSVKTGTAIASSKVPLRKWAIAIYLETTNLKGVSSMKLHRDLGVTQTTAWFMLARIRESFASLADPGVMAGPVEVDETYVGGLERNKHASKKLHAGRGAVGKTAVVGARDRATGQVAARVIESADAETLQGFVTEHATEAAQVYTDGSTAYDGMANREAVYHSVGEYVREQVHTNGMESFWAVLKRAHKGTFHRLSPKHLHRYVAEFAGRHNIREHDTIRQMGLVAAGLVGRRVTYAELVAPGGGSPIAVVPAEDPF